MGLRRAIVLLLLATTLLAARGACVGLVIDTVLPADTSVCLHDPVRIEAFGEFPDNTLFQWQEFLDGGWSNLLNDTDSVLIATPSDTTFYRLLAICPDDTVISDPVRVTVRPLPSATNSGSVTFCGSDTDTIFFFFSGGAGPWEAFFNTPGGPVSVPVNEDTFDIPSPDPGPYFLDSLSMAGCLGTELGEVLQVTVAAPPSAAHGDSAVLCAGDPDASITFTFDGDGPWDVTINGPGGPYGETGNTSGSFTIDDPGPGTYQVDTLTNVACPNDTLNNGGPLIVTVNAQPSQATIDSAPETLCQNTTGLLVAFAPNTGSGSWAQVSGPPVQLIPESSLSVSFTPSAVGLYGFVWTVSHEPCDPSIASASVTVIPNAPPANAGPSVTLCSGMDATLQGNAAAPGEGNWTIVSSPTGSSATFSDTTDEHSVFTPDTDGEYLLRWTISNPPCDPTDSSVLVTVVQSGSAPTVLGLDDEPACDGEYQTLTIQNPINGTTYHWACDAWEAPVPDGAMVTVQWAYGEDTLVTITVTSDGPCQVPAVHSVLVSPATASCPKGIVYFEPHGLAILDPTANYFQWGTLDDSGHFVPVDGWDEQTTFIPGLTNCDSSIYVVRTSIDGAQCWSTTVSCATSEMLDRYCPLNGGMVQEPHLRIYPNPSNGGPVTLEATGGDGDLLNLDVGDLNGRTLSRSILRMNGVSTTMLDLDRLDRGIYVLRAWNTEMDRTLKLVID